MCMHVYPCIYVVYAESPEHETLFFFFEKHMKPCFFVFLETLFID